MLRSAKQKYWKKLKHNRVIRNRDNLLGIKWLPCWKYFNLTDILRNRLDISENYVLKVFLNGSKLLK